jgi:hypothetical protein
MEVGSNSRSRTSNFTQQQKQLINQELLLKRHYADIRHGIDPETLHKGRKARQKAAGVAAPTPPPQWNGVTVSLKYCQCNTGSMTQEKSLHKTSCGGVTASAADTTHRRGTHGHHPLRRARIKTVVVRLVSERNTLVNTGKSSSTSRRQRRTLSCRGIQGWRGRVFRMADARC